MYASIRFSYGLTDRADAVRMAATPLGETAYPWWSSMYRAMASRDMYCARSLTRSLMMCPARVSGIDTYDRATIRLPHPVHSPVSRMSVQWQHFPAPPALSADRARSCSFAPRSSTGITSKSHGPIRSTCLFLTTRVDFSIGLVQQADTPASGILKDASDFSVPPLRDARRAPSLHSPSCFLPSCFSFSFFSSSFPSLSCRPSPPFPPPAAPVPGRPCAPPAAPAPALFPLFLFPPGALPPPPPPPAAGAAAGTEGGSLCEPIVLRTRFRTL